MKIPLKHDMAALMTQKVAQLSVDAKGKFTEEMYLLAQQVFPTDRRFHLEPEFDSAGAASTIRAYMDYWKNVGATVLKIVEHEELLGFTILQRVSDDAYENVLGVTRPGIKGKMAAYPLYCGMLDYIKAQSGTKYIGRVSTANIPSVNLHLQLGAKIRNVYDEYILRKKPRQKLTDRKEGTAL